MKIIEPSAKIIEGDLPTNTYQRIDACASVCYQRPPKPIEEEAQEFCQGMIKRGHFATLEMAVISVVCDSSVIPPDSKFIHKRYLDTDKVVMTGSIRAFMEAIIFGELPNFLRENCPLFFGDCVNYGPAYIKGCEPVRFAEPHEIPWQHKHVAVRFIVNRAVSHELVRHRPCSFLQESQRYCRYEDEVTFIRPEWFDKSKQSTSGSAEYDWEAHMNACECRYKEFLYRKFSPQQARAVLPNSTKTEVVCYASLPQWLHMFNLRCSPAADPEMVRIMRPLREQFKSTYPEAFE